MIKKIKELAYKLLVRTQGLTGTDNVYLAKQGSCLVIGNIINVVASFLLAMAFGRLLPIEIYGDYRYILSIIIVVGIFALPGIDDAILQAVANNFDGSFKKGLKEKLKWSVLGSIACLIMSGYFFFFKDNFDLTISLIIASVFFPVLQSTGLYLSYLGGKKFFGIQTTYNVLTQIISSLFIIIALFLTNSLIVLVLVYFLSYAVLGATFFILSIKKFPPNNNVDEKFIGFGKHLSLFHIVSTVANQIDKILLFNLLGPAQLAIYSFASMPTSEANIFLKNVRALALPKFSTKTKEEIKKTLLTKIFRATLIMALLVIAFILIAPFIYKILFPQYIDSINYARLLFLIVLFFPFSLIPLYFQAQMMKKELYQFGIISQIIIMTLTIVLVPVWGVIGAITARLAGQFVSVILSIILFKKS